MNYFEQVSVLISENKWIEQFLSGQGYCIICNHTDPLDLEYHHVAGKNNDEFIISVCRNCHGRLSRKQRLWPKQWTNKNNSQDLKYAFLLNGLADVFNLQANLIFRKYKHD